MVHYNTPGDFYHEQDRLLFSKAKPVLQENGFFGLATGHFIKDRYNFTYLNDNEILRLSQCIYSDGRQSLRLSTLNLDGAYHGSYFGIFSAPYDRTYGDIYNFTYADGKFKKTSKTVNESFIRNCFSALAVAHPEGQEKQALFTNIADVLTSGRLATFSTLLKSNIVTKDTFFKPVK